MESPTPAPVAVPAAAAAPVERPASEAAIVTGKTADYREARRAERAGKPLAAVPIAAVDPAAPVVENRKTRAERDQDRINESIRTAGESAAAPLKTRIAELEAQLHGKPAAEAARPAEAAAVVVEELPAKKTPEYKRIMALDGAPKLADFDSVEEHAFAAAEFIDTVRTNERAAAARTQETHQTRFAAEQAADDAFFKQLDDAKKTDATFPTKLSAEVKALTPIEWLPRDAQGRPVDAQGQPIQTGPLHVVASELRKSPVVRDLMLHFSQHPEELKKFAEMPAAVAALRDPNVRLRAHVQHIVREFNRLEGRFTASGAAAVAAEPELKTISDAPDPAVVLGSRPVEPGDPLAKAIKSGSTRAYRELRRAERAKSGGR